MPYVRSVPLALGDLDCTGHFFYALRSNVTLLLTVPTITAKANLSLSAGITDYPRILGDRGHSRSHWLEHLEENSMQTLARPIREYPLLAFFVLAYLLSWPASLVPGENAILEILSTAGPTLAAVIVMAAIGSSENLFARLVQWRAGVIWYAVAILGPFLLAFIALAVVLLLRDAPSNIVQQMPWAALPAIALGRLLNNVWEELGWRGFALPMLQSRYSALVASLILGILWGVWHIPLFVSGAMPAELPIVAFFVEIVAISVVYTWIYNNTGGSLLFVTLFHVFENTATLLVVGGGVNVALYSYVHAAVVVVVALLVVLIYRPDDLMQGSGEVPTLPGLEGA